MTLSHRDTTTFWFFPCHHVLHVPVIKNWLESPFRYHYWRGHLKYWYLRFFTDTAEEPSKWVFPAFFFSFFELGWWTQFYLTVKSICSLCFRSFQIMLQDFISCHHVVHASCMWWRWQLTGSTCQLSYSTTTRTWKFRSEALNGNIALYVSFLLFYWQICFFFFFAFYSELMIKGETEPRMSTAKTTKTRQLRPPPTPSLHHY